MESLIDRWQHQSSKSKPNRQAIGTDRVNRYEEDKHQYQRDNLDDRRRQTDRVREEYKPKQTDRVGEPFKTYEGVHGDKSQKTNSHSKDRTNRNNHLSKTNQQVANNINSTSHNKQRNNESNSKSHSQDKSNRKGTRSQQKKNGSHTEKNQTVLVKIPNISFSESYQKIIDQYVSVIIGIFDRYPKEPQTYLRNVLESIFQQWSGRVKQAETSRNDSNRDTNKYTPPVVSPTISSTTRSLYIQYMQSQHQLSLSAHLLETKQHHITQLKKHNQSLQTQISDTKQELAYCRKELKRINDDMTHYRHLSVEKDRQISDKVAVISQLEKDFQEQNKIMREQIGVAYRMMEVIRRGRIQGAGDHSHHKGQNSHHNNHSIYQNHNVNSKNISNHRFNENSNSSNESSNIHTNAIDNTNRNSIAVTPTNTINSIPNLTNSPHSKPPLSQTSRSNDKQRSKEQKAG